MISHKPKCSGKMTVIYMAKETNAQSVEIILSNNFEYEILACNKDQEGNYLQPILKLTSFTINLISIYAPNLDRPDFFTNIQSLIETDIALDYNVIFGDFNLVLDPKMDSDNYKNIIIQRHTKLYSIL